MSRINRGRSVKDQVGPGTRGPEPGAGAYNVGQLRQDLDRFSFLLGGDDGKSLFGPDAAG